jgi:hypothetical protein
LKYLSIRSLPAGSTPTASIFSYALDVKEIYTLKRKGGGPPLIYFKGFDDLAAEMGSLVSD